MSNLTNGSNGDATATNAMMAKSLLVRFFNMFLSPILSFNGYT